MDIWRFSIAGDFSILNFLLFVFKVGKVVHTFLYQSFNLKEVYQEANSDLIGATTHLLKHLKLKELTKC